MIRAERQVPKNKAEQLDKQEQKQKHLTVEQLSLSSRWPETLTGHSSISHSIVS